MGITIDFDEESERRLHDLMRERGISFNAAANDAIRAGLANASGEQAAFRQKTFTMGAAPRPLDKALQIAGELEEQERRKKMELEE